MTLRKLVAVAIVSAWGAAAVAAPTVYGFLRKEIRSFSETAKTEPSRANYLAVTDVAGGESRFGLKGGGDLESTKYNYQMEFGVRTNDPAANLGADQKFGIRVAKVGMEGGFGGVTIGEDWSPISAFMSGKVDVLTNTVAGYPGDNNNDYFSNANKLLGGAYLYRGRLDMVQYATPVFAGFKYILTYDTENKGVTYGYTDNTGGVTPTTEATAIEHAIAYDNKDIGLKVLAAMYTITPMTKVDTVAAGSATGANKFAQNGMQIGATWENGPIFVGAGFGNATINDATTSTNNDYWNKRNRTFVAFKYALDKLDLALSYGQVTAGSDDSDTQLGFAATYKYTADVSSSFAYKTLTAKSNGMRTFGTDGEKENTGTWIGIGTTVAF